MKNFIAHSKNEYDKEHLLSEHLEGVAIQLENFLSFLPYKKIFKVTGLLHDFGKYQLAFQRYLREGGRRGSVPHASWGAALCKDYNHIEAAFAIDGHHKGLPDKGDLKSDLYQFAETDIQLFDEVKKEFLIQNRLSEEDLKYYDTNLRGTDKELFIRLLFSALTDADWLDTERHFNSSIAEKRHSITFDPNYLIEKVEKEILGKSKEGYINQLRNEVRNYAVFRAQSEI